MVNFGSGSKVGRNEMDGCEKKIVYIFFVGLGYDGYYLASE